MAGRKFILEQVCSEAKHRDRNKKKTLKDTLVGIHPRIMYEI